MQGRKSYLDEVLQPVGVQKAYDESHKEVGIHQYRPEKFRDFVGLIGRMEPGTEIAVELPVIPGMMPSSGFLSASLGANGYEAIVVIQNPSSENPLAYVIRK